MTGHNIARLKQAISGMNPGAVEHAQRGWNDGGETLGQVARDVQTTQDNLDHAFAPGSAVRRAAAEVLTTVRQGVERDHDRMTLASTTLVSVASIMRTTQSQAGQMPVAAPGSPPQVEGGPFEDDADEIHALKVYASKSRAYTQQVDAYDAADADAARQVEQLNAEYDRAADVFAGMHDEPEPDSGSGTTATSAGTGSSSPSTGTTRPTSFTPQHPTTVGTTPNVDGTDTSQPGQHHPTDPTAPGQGADDPTQDPVGPDSPGGPGVELVPPGGAFQTVTPDSPGFPGSTIAPDVGAAGLGVLGGLGLRNLLTGAPPTVSVPGQPVTRPIGTTTRSGSGSVLGRSTTSGRGSLAPGQSTSRGTAGRGVGSAGGRRRKGEDDDEAEKEIYDVERDWTDDEGQFPPVIG